MATSLKRTLFKPRVNVLNAKLSPKQDVDFTGFFEVNDIVDVIDVDSHGNIISVILDNAQILAVEENVAVILDQSVDTTLATVNAMIRVQQIDDGQSAVERLYRRRIKGDISFNLSQPINAQVLNAPIAGQTTFEVADTTLFRVGDVMDLIADEGLIQANVTISAVNINADSVNNSSNIVISSLVDTSTFTNPLMIDRTVTVQKAIERNQERIDGIDTPIENEFIGIGNSKDVAFESVNLFVSNSSKVFLDGTRKRIGIAGTRASATFGTGNAQIIATSMILGLDGNKTTVTVQAGAGVAVVVTGNYSTGFIVTVNDNGGTATAKDIANAINADVVAKRLVQVQYNLDGLGLFVATSGLLAGGLDDGTGDYAELEQIFGNNISGTGFKWVAFHIRPNERNRMDEPPEDDEDIAIDYRKATENVNR